MTVLTDTTWIDWVLSPHRDRLAFQIADCVQELAKNPDWVAVEGKRVMTLEAYRACADLFMWGPVLAGVVLITGSATSDAIGTLERLLWRHGDSGWPLVRNKSDLLRHLNGLPKWGVIADTQVEVVRRRADQWLNAPDTRIRLAAEDRLHPYPVAVYPMPGTSEHHVLDLPFLAPSTFFKFRRLRLAELG